MAMKNKNRKTFKGTKLWIFLLFIPFAMTGYGQNNIAYNTDFVSTLKPWYIPAEYTWYDLSSETWNDSYLEFDANNKFRLVKRNTNDRDFLFVTGDYLFNYSNNLLYLKFTDSVSLESYEMVFDIAYCKLKRKKLKIVNLMGVKYEYKSKSIRYKFQKKTGYPIM